MAKEKKICIEPIRETTMVVKLVGDSIAMGNASMAAKEKAEYVTTHIHEDGIYNALKHYGLI